MAMGTKTVIVLEDEGDIPLTDGEVALVTPTIVSPGAGVIVKPTPVGTVKVETPDIGGAIG